MRLPPPQHLTMLGCIFMPKDRNFITLIKSVSGETEIHVLVYSKQQSVDLLGYIQFISVGAQPQQCSTCALTYKLFVFYLVFCKGFKRCRVHKVNILLIVVGMIHKLTSYSDSFTQLFPYKMHLHIDVENAYTKKSKLSSSQHRPSWTISAAEPPAATSVLLQHLLGVSVDTAGLHCQDLVRAI